MTDVIEEYLARLDLWSDIQGHLRFMRETVVQYNSPTVIELGIQAGNSTSALLAGVLVSKGTLYSCDIQTREQLKLGVVPGSGGWRRIPDDWWDLPYWKTLCGTTGDDLSAEALAWMPEECDVLFVDTEHTTEHVLAVMDEYMPRVKEGGVALFHDTHWTPGDVESPIPDGPVAAGIDQYCSAHGIPWEDRPGSYGMGVVQL